jgi:hypothetical protein
MTMHSITMCVLNFWQVHQQVQQVDSFSRGCQVCQQCVPKLLSELTSLDERALLAGNSIPP